MHPLLSDVRCKRAGSSLESLRWTRGRSTGRQARIGSAHKSEHDGAAIEVAFPEVLMAGPSPQARPIRGANLRAGARSGEGGAYPRVDRACLLPDQNVANLLAA